jgi:hypothetical protein
MFRIPPMRHRLLPRLLILLSIWLPATAVWQQPKVLSGSSRTPIALSIPYTARGTTVTIPEVVAERFNIPPRQQVAQLAPATRRRIDRFVESLLPCWGNEFDEVTILRQPDPPGVGEGAASQGFMTGVTALRARDESQPLGRNNYTIKLYLFLPDELLLGSTGMNAGIRSSNVIPYAGSPTPTTYGEYLDWTLAHETWHLIDIQARLERIFAAPQANEADLERVLHEPGLWDREYAGFSVSEVLGWANHGDAYAMGDELSAPVDVTQGRTTYRLERGAFSVHYADEAYSFERGFVRTGSLPDALYSLSDLAPLIKGGRYPTLYAIFSSEAERFAEFGAWFWFSQLVGAEERFRQLHPALYERYDERWGAALVRCRH